MVVNLTGTEADSATFITVGPAGAEAAAVSNLNLATGGSRANLAIALLSPDGRLRVTNANGAAHLVLDVIGWYGEGGGAKYLPVQPFRLSDTRVGTGAIGPGSIAQVDVGARPEGVPGPPLRTSSAMLSVTAVNPTEPSFLTLFQTDRTARPIASSLNPTPGDATTNEAIVSTSGPVGVYNLSGQADFIVDVVGYFAGG